MIHANTSHADARHADAWRADTRRANTWRANTPRGIARYLAAWVAAAVVLWWPGTLAAAASQQDEPPQVQMAFAATNNPVYVGEDIKLLLTIRDATPDVTPTLPEPFADRAAGPSVERSSMSTIVSNNGNIQRIEREMRQYRWRLPATQAGELTIPPIEVVIDGRSYRSAPLTVTVQEPVRSDILRAEIAVDDTEPFVGEPIEMTIRVLVDRRAEFGSANFETSGLARLVDPSTPTDGRRRSRRNSVNFLDQPLLFEEQGVVDVEGREYTAFRATCTVIPTRAGDLEYGPVTLMGLLRRNSFARSERIAIASNAVPMNVRPLPEQGRPENFSGIVGAVQLTAQSSDVDVAVGEPMTLTLVLSGLSRRQRIEPIDLAAADPAFAQNFRIDDDVTTTTAGGTVTFEYLLRVAKDTVDAIPSIGLPYFDPESEAYGIARTRALPLNVTSTRLVTAADAEGGEEPVAGGRTLDNAAASLAFNYEGPGLLTDQRFDAAAALGSPVVIALAAAPPAAWLGVLAFGAVRSRRDSGMARRRARAASDAKRLLDEAAAEPAPADIAAGVARALAVYAAAKRGVSDAGVTPADAAEMLAPSLDDASAGEVNAIVSECDAARFGGMSPGDAQSLVHRARAVITAAERSRRRVATDAASVGGAA